MDNSALKSNIDALVQIYDKYEDVEIKDRAIIRCFRGMEKKKKLKKYLSLICLGNVERVSMIGLVNALLPSLAIFISLLSLLVSVSANGLDGREVIMTVVLSGSPALLVIIIALISFYDDYMSARQESEYLMKIRYINAVISTAPKNELKL